MLVKATKKQISWAYWFENIQLRVYVFRHFTVRFKENPIKVKILENVVVSFDEHRREIEKKQKQIKSDDTVQLEFYENYLFDYVNVFKWKKPTQRKSDHSKLFVGNLIGHLNGENYFQRKARNPNLLIVYSKQHLVSKFYMFMEKCWMVSKISNSVILAPKNFFYQVWNLNYTFFTTTASLY